ncbi:hypothetical protein BC826DRAFT_976304 [Russula brevipes]|nr:hypothetical protein BC826DRAFT_976304 [Russula brevipes]
MRSQKGTFSAAEATCIVIVFVGGPCSVVQKLENAARVVVMMGSDPNTKTRKRQKKKRRLPLDLDLVHSSSRDTGPAQGPRRRRHYRSKGPDNAAGPSNRAGMEIIAVVTSNMRLDSASTSFPRPGTARALGKDLAILTCTFYPDIAEAGYEIDEAPGHEAMRHEAGGMSTSGCATMQVTCETVTHDKCPRRQTSNYGVTKKRASFGPSFSAYGNSSGSNRRGC